MFSVCKNIKLSLINQQFFLRLMEKYAFFYINATSSP